MSVTTGTYRASTQPAQNARPTMPSDEMRPPLPVNPVQIEKVANGFVLRVGCKTFVAKTWKEASVGLLDYWNDPVAAEKKYIKNWELIEKDN